MIALALLGCAALLGGSAAFPAGAMLGYALAVASAVVWASYSVLARRFREVPSGAVAGFCGATAVLAAAQVSGAVGRILWGAAADRLRDGLLVLLGVAGLMAAGSAAVTALSAAWPVPLMAGSFMLLGATAVGWNGVYLSEVARLSPAHAVGAVTGSAMCVTFAGVVVGPALFSALHDLAGSYARGYWLLVAFSLAGAGCVMAARRGGRAL